MKFKNKYSNQYFEIIDNKDELKTKIKDLSNEFENTKIIYDEKLRELYWYKLCLYTFDLKIIEPILEESNEKMELYKSFIAHKLDNILSNKNNILDNYFGKNKRRALRILIKILKDNNRKIDLEHIIKDSFLLNLLNLFEKENGFEYFFYVYKVNRDVYINNEDYKEVFRLEKNISLYTASFFQNSKNKNIIFELYDLLRCSKKEDKLEDLPEGIIGINYKDNYFNYVANNIKSKISNKIVLPKSLKYIDGNFFNNLLISSVTLSSNTNYISRDAFNTKELKQVRINIDCSAKEFSNYQDRNNVLNIIKAFLIIEYNNISKTHPKLHSYINNYVNKNRFVFYHEGMNYMHLRSYGYDICTNVEILLCFNDAYIVLNDKLASNFTNYIGKDKLHNYQGVSDNDIELVMNKIVKLK